METGMEKVIKDGKVAVLTSYQGWFSANRDRPEMLFDPEMVAAVLERQELENNADRALNEYHRCERADQKKLRAKADEYFYAVCAAKQKIKAIAEKKYPGAGGFEKLTIEWVPAGSRFTVQYWDWEGEVLITEAELDLTA
jgi:hypothetical protein